MPDRYIVDPEPIGGGTFGVVSKGRDTLLEHDVAVKVLDPLITEFEAVEQARFKREAQTLARLSHPHIPAIYDVDFSEDRFLLYVQYIDGINLEQLIEEEDLIDLSTARTWFLQIASALSHAHAAGVIHRDVKPANIVVTRDRESAYLVDFGIALTKADTEKLTGTGWTMGTPGYMSPEQIAGEELDQRSDIYSLAVTLFETLSGKPLPPGDYEPLANVNEAVPPDVDALIQDSIQQLRDARVDSAATFAKRLAGAFNPKPLSDVLLTGHLHEIQAALEPLSPGEFHQLPPGQQTLILTKAADIVASGQPSLQYASERFLEFLLTRALLVVPDRYREIASASVEWAFEREFGEYVGLRRLQSALADAAAQAPEPAHEVLCGELLDFLDKVTLDDKEIGYLHGLRDVIQSLLANPVCGAESANRLGLALQAVNLEQRSRS